MKKMIALLVIGMSGCATGKPDLVDIIRASYYRGCRDNEYQSDRYCATRARNFNPYNTNLYRSTMEVCEKDNLKDVLHNN